MLPATARAWEHLTRTAQELFARYGYEPIYTPLFEHTEVFTRGIGEATDIVSKEMYTFEDKGGRSITLRPEGTASVVRAALEHSLTANGQFAKLYYAGPMFRYERPQKGRMRQFWQIGAELLGAAEPTADAEVITLLWRFFEACGIPAENMRLLLNSMGDEHCRPAYRDKVAAYIRDARGRAVRGVQPPRRHQPAARVRLQEPGVPGGHGRRAAAARRAVRRVRDALRGGQGALDASRHPVRRGPVARARARLLHAHRLRGAGRAGLGSQNAIGGGGRYDRLMEEYGGPADAGARLRARVRAHAARDGGRRRRGGQPAARRGLRRARRRRRRRRRRSISLSALRDAGIAAECDHQGRSLKSQFKQADRLGAGAVVVVGPDELASDGVFEVTRHGRVEPGRRARRRARLRALAQFATGVVDDERLARLLTERFGF